MLSGYNTHGLVTQDEEVVEMENAVLRNYGNGTASLTSYLDSPSLDRGVENEMDFLRETEEMIHVQKGLNPQRHYDSDWHSLDADSGCPSLPAPPLHSEMEDSMEQDLDASLERLLRQQMVHRHSVTSFLKASSLPPDTRHGEHRPASQHQIMDGSLTGVRDLTESLFQLREAQLRQREVLHKNKRRTLSLARHSNSCPVLGQLPQTVLLSPIQEDFHHKSMHDLISQSEDAAGGHQVTGQASPLPLSTHQDSFDQAPVRICLNGVTVDSSEDFPRQGVAASADSSTPLGQSGLGPLHGGDELELVTRRGSWQPEPKLNDAPIDRKSQQTRVMMLAMSGKSLSLTSLDPESESDSEEALEAEARASQAVGASIRAISMPRAVARPEGSGSPTDSCASSPTGHASPDPRDHMLHLHGKMDGDLSLSSHNAKSLSDLSSTDRPRPQSMDIVSSQDSSPGGTHQNSFEEALSVPHPSMTKSLSTPSIPQAVELDDRPKTLRERHEEKHPDEDYQRFLDEYEQSPNDSDERSSKGGRKEEKKRKQSVFSRFQSSYRTKKSKEKESKSKGHRFVSVSFSNNTLCDACRKAMANKVALRCENCLVNVHEHNCKDQIPLCDKNRNKALQRDGSGHGPHGPPHTASQGALLERQSAPGPSGTSLRPSHSFKDKRSSSAPIKPQANQQLTASPAAHLTHRHSLPTNSKSISEEAESDQMSTATDPAHPSNMADTISESMESLNDVAMAEVSVLDDEPDLEVLLEEQEAWSITVDRKTLKKLNTKDIKRQDTIWELIQTERQYVKRLKIMQKIFAAKMLDEMNFTSDQVDRLFPRLDDLVELHANFLRQLLNIQAKNPDKFVDEIGGILVNQFQEEPAEKMKSIYGVFCSKHTEAMQLYKDFVRGDKRFQNFAKCVTNMPVCEKRDISDFILGVTVRLSKYAILIEAILKSTKDKKDRENLSQALLMAKDVVQHVDEKVAAYEKLVDIQAKLDSRAVVYRNKKFKRQDLTADGRELMHSGKIGWKSARGRVYDVLAVVLTDLIVFLQKNEQKYTFLMQDNKSCVIPLYRLLVREKRDARDSLGIYMISQNRTTPEMYELVCASKREREDWLRLLEDAIRACPPDPEPVQQAGGAAPAQSSNEEKRRKEEHANHIKDIIEQLHKKDEAIRECCEDKNKLMLDLMELSAPHNREPGSRPSSQEIVQNNESVEIVQAAIEEASRLTSILQTSSVALSRSVSSVGEHHSPAFVATPVPKRAETFAGFDSNHGRNRFAEQGEEEGLSSSNQSLNESEEQNLKKTLPPQDMPASVDQSTSPTAASPQHPATPHLWDMSSSSDQGSMGELSATSMSSLIPVQANQEPMTSILHLVQYLNTLLSLTSKQNTKVESLRAELAEAKEEISKLSHDVHSGRRGIRGHDQLEELRNLQEHVSRERSEWEQTREQHRREMDREREQLERERRELEESKNEFQLRREDFKRQKEALQCQMDMLRGQGHHIEDSPDGSESLESESQRPGHRRSVSADFYNASNLSEPGDAIDKRGLPRHPRLSTGSLGQQGVTAPAKQAGLPMHLLSARNEQRMGGTAGVQHGHKLPFKLSSSPGTAGERIGPSPAFSAGRQQPFPGRSGLSRVQSMSAASRPQRHAASQDDSGRSTGGLSGIMKLADPKGAKSPSLPNNPAKGAAPQAGGGAPGAPVAQEGAGEHFC